jgi:hypothetical protein
MRRTGKQTTGIFLVVLLTTVLAAAQTELSGPVSGTLGPGDFIVVGDVEVPAGETLSIASGSTFLFSGHYTWLVRGQLIAMGTESDSIVFTQQSQIPEHKWGGIRFLDGAMDGNILSYCSIDNCENYFFPYFYGGGLATEGPSIDVWNTTITQCSAADAGAFYGMNGAQVNFIDCVITENLAGNGGGLLYDSGTSGEIRNCTILKNISTST